MGLGLGVRVRASPREHGAYLRTKLAMMVFVVMTVTRPSSRIFACKLMCFLLRLVRDVNCDTPHQDSSCAPPPAAEAAAEEEELLLGCIC